MAIEPVVQKEVSGCGIACVAMLTRKTYTEVNDVANSNGIFADDQRLWSETAYVRTLLAKFKIKADPGETDFSSWGSLPDLALLAIKYHLEYGRPFWHWVVFIRDNGQDVVLDPAAYLENNRRTDLENITPKWFIGIEGT